MGNYKVVDADKLDADMTTVADAIRERAGTTEKLAFPAGMAAAISEITDYFSLALLDQLTEYTNKEVTSVRMFSFYGCKQLLKLDFWKASYIGSGAFAACLNLTTIILRSDTVCVLQAQNTFNDTPFSLGGTSGGTEGTVYVPAALIESYKVATNWSTLYEGGTCNFVAIEGSEYE